MAEGPATPGAERPADRAIDVAPERLAGWIDRFAAAHGGVVESTVDPDAVRLTAADGTVARCHLRDPSWFQWPLLEVAVYGNIVADFPLCNKSFNCSYSGADL